jgi:hypothetical protein
MLLLLSNIWLAGNKLAFFLLQEGEKSGQTATEDFSLWGMIQKMEWPALLVAFVLAIMSMYSIAVMVERWLTFNAARNQSRQFAPKVAAALRDNRIDEAIAISDRHKKSHLAMVVNAGLQEFQAHQTGSDIPGTTMDAARRALQRATALKTAELKRGLSGAVRRIARNGHRDHRRVPGDDGRGRNWHLGSRRRHLRSPDRDGLRAAGGNSGGVGLQHLYQQGRRLHYRDGQFILGADRLLHQAS